MGSYVLDGRQEAIYILGLRKDFQLLGELQTLGFLVWFL